ncbi:MAG: hypothetical protein Q7R47_05495 [Candidatus Diapherotrites archaeon]|nr:hypothetical protein [Candidatus Diapherotrites archaeon]
MRRLAQRRTQKKQFHEKARTRKQLLKWRQSIERAIKREVEHIRDLDFTLRHSIPTPSEREELENRLWVARIVLQGYLDRKQHIRQELNDLNEGKTSEPVKAKNGARKN